MKKKFNVLVIDDAFFIRNIIKKAINRKPSANVDYIFEILSDCVDGKEGLDLFKLTTPDVVTVDINMPNINGSKFITEALKIKPDAQIIVISSNDSKQQEIINQGAYFIQKPIKETSLWKLLDNIANKLISNKISLNNENINTDKQPISNTKDNVKTTVDKVTKKEVVTENKTSNDVEDKDIKLLNGTKNKAVSILTTNIIEQKNNKEYENSNEAKPIDTQQSQKKKRKKKKKKKAISLDDGFNFTSIPLSIPLENKNKKNISEETVIKNTKDKNQCIKKDKSIDIQDKSLNLKNENKKKTSINGKEDLSKVTKNEPYATTSSINMKETIIDDNNTNDYKYNHENNNNDKNNDEFIIIDDLDESNISYDNQDNNNIKNQNNIFEKDEDVVKIKNNDINSESNDSNNGSTLIINDSNFEKDDSESLSLEDFTSNDNYESNIEESNNESFSLEDFTLNETNKDDEIIIKPKIEKTKDNQIETTSNFQIDKDIPLANNEKLTKEEQDALKLRLSESSKYNLASELNKKKIEVSQEKKEKKKKEEKFINYVPNNDKVDDNSESTEENEKPHTCFNNSILSSREELENQLEQELEELDNNNNFDDIIFESDSNSNNNSTTNTKNSFDSASNLELNNIATNYNNNINEKTPTSKIAPPINNLMSSEGIILKGETNNTKESAKKEKKSGGLFSFFKRKKK